MTEPRSARALAFVWWHPRLRISAPLLVVGFHMGLKLVIQIGCLYWGGGSCRMISGKRRRSRGTAGTPWTTRF